jgi:deoxycytidylate deaminase
LGKNIKMSNYELKWSDLAFNSKKPLKELKATFIACPRQISLVRFTQLVKQYLPTGNIVIGLSENKFVDGFADQFQFKTMQLQDIKSLIEKVNKSASPNKITILYCKQSDLVSIYEKISFKKVVLVNGSWQFTFHTRPDYYALITNKIPFDLASPFADEIEAIKYADDFEKQMSIQKTGIKLSEIEMIQSANQVAKNSFDHSFQSGVALGKKAGSKYELLATAFNKTVPYQTFAWHFGPSRERHLAAPGDLNYYDTIHAEVNLIVQAGKTGLKLKDTTLFINLLPCPTCAKVLCETDIAEIVYSIDHSNGYAVALLEKAGKKVRRLLDNENLIITEG